MKMIEVSGADVESAIARGLNQLGVGREAVSVEVVDEGRKGFLGLGGREALVRLVVSDVLSAEPVAEVVATPVAEMAPEPEPEPELLPELVAVEPEPEPEPEAQPVVDTAADELTQVTVEVIETLLAKMGFEADVSVRHSEPDDLTGRAMLIVDVQNGDAGDLIGSRGDKLNDFQYLVRLMVGHRMKERADFLIDVEGYRARRHDALKRLAERMADKAIERNRPVTLEPMTPYDRRIVHMSLRSDERVETGSTGEGSHRRVRVYPK